MDFDDLPELSKPITKLIETVSNAMGVLFYPKKIKREANADARAISVISDAIRNNNDLDISFEKNGIKINNLDNIDMIERSLQRRVFQDYIKEINIENVVSMAVERLKEEKVVSNEAVEMSWINMLLDSVSYVDNEELQKIWSQILVSEVIKPGQTSLRTLETVKCLSPCEVRMFEKLSNYILRIKDDVHDVYDYFILNDERVFEQIGISIVDLLKLEDAGLIANSVNMFEEIIKNKNEKKEIYSGLNQVVITINNNSNMTFRTEKRIFLLSEAGREVYETVYSDTVSTNICSYYKLVESIIYEKNNQIIRNEIKDLKL